MAAGCHRDCTPNYRNHQGNNPRTSGGLYNPNQQNKDKTEKYTKLFFYVHKDEIKRIMRKHRKAEIDCMAPCYDYSFDNKKCNEGI